MSELFSQIELPLCTVLAEMEHEGFLVDRNALTEYGNMLAGAASKLEKSIYELAANRSTSIRRNSWAQFSLKN
jgi:DNA polymerase-1